MNVSRSFARHMSSDSIKSSLMLSRIPIVTRALTSFEKEYFNYQAELEKRLMRTFPQYYYFKKGTLAERKFLDVQHGVTSKQPNLWYPKGVPDIKHGRDRRSKQEILIPKEEANDNDEKNLSRPIIVNPRITEADKNNNMSSLSRKLSRTLYLIVKEKDQWKFPSFDLQNQPLHTAAENGLIDLSRDKIRIWTVSNTPAAVIKYSKGELVAPTYTSNANELMERHYIIKSHIVAGSFQPMNIEYKWVTNDEASGFLDSSYFQQVRHLLANF